MTEFDTNLFLGECGFIGSSKVVVKIYDFHISIQKHKI